MGNTNSTVLHDIVDKIVEYNSNNDLFKIEYEISSDRINTTLTKQVKVYLIGYFDSENFTDINNKRDDEMFKIKIADSQFDIYDEKLLYIRSLYNYFRTNKEYDKLYNVLNDNMKHQINGLMHGVTIRIIIYLLDKSEINLETEVSITPDGTSVKYKNGNDGLYKNYEKWGFIGNNKSMKTTVKILLKIYKKLGKKHKHVFIIETTKPQVDNYDIRNKLDFYLEDSNDEVKEEESEANKYFNEMFMKSLKL